MSWPELFLFFRLFYKSKNKYIKETVLRTYFRSDLIMRKEGVVSLNNFPCIKYALNGHWINN